MELRHLTYFIAVAEELHFGRAAQRLHISQPPLSQQIRRLEEEIGVRLLNRTKRRVEITPAGEAFLAEARQIIAAAEEAVRRAVRADKGEIGSLAVGFIGSANYSVLPPVIREFRRRFPDVEISLTEMNTSNQIEALRAGRIQAGFLRPPPGIEAAGLATAPVFREPLVVAMSQNHPLQGELTLPLRLLAKESFIMIPRRRGPGYFDYLITLCRQEGFSPYIVLEASQFHTIIGLVAAELGIAVVPASMQRSRFAGVVFRTVAGGAETVLHMVWMNNSNSPVLDNFLTVAREVAGSLMPAAA
ncbi:MAG TPA: LysR family transcriptional regulator [Syntrophales bacterium]|jgi:DNA-binding transcriptional LysR family regulator|nr:LysR family transcriptional regulator [Syntrophales bacterium]HPC33429.1 LysR family transcriptional regulator [Syntrophales bacterium]HQG35041.1 LysR family transcriptional regulator [Syntrophales bacterium]HQI36388.1 LysR family transcriptional regulator [Syntrophales bacterium]HRR47988.1 LysR family transcriptional regulator [Syntrophales bacterium]